LHGQRSQQQQKQQQQQPQQQHSRGSSVCTQAAASSSAFQGPDGFSGGDKSTFLSAFWRFLRPHTIRGTILGTSAVVTKVGKNWGSNTGNWSVTFAKCNI
jgi:hypothetical protein